MLHEEILTPETLALLKTLMQDPELSSFNLVGGTGLALYLGHRKSIDLDLFTVRSFDAKELENYFIEKYDFKESYIEENTLKGSINGIKIDCITYSYPLVEPVHHEDGIRIFSMKDIAAMKLSAITDSGSRLKDFIDIAYLSTKYTLNEMLEAYSNKYKNTNEISPVKALIYYDDIKEREPIMFINGNYSWNLIDKRLQLITKTPDRIFPEAPIEQKQKYK
jgi:hypothetical protein